MGGKNRKKAANILENEKKFDLKGDRKLTSEILYEKKTSQKA